MSLKQIYAASVGLLALAVGIGVGAAPALAVCGICGMLYAAVLAGGRGV